VAAKGYRHANARARRGEEGDFVEHLFTATTHDYLMFFTAPARLRRKSLRDSEMGRAAKGRSIANILELKPMKNRGYNSRPIKKSGTGPNAVDETWDEICTSFLRRIRIVKNQIIRLRQRQRGGIIAIQIEDGDRLIDAKLTNAITRSSSSRRRMSLRFHEEQLRDSGSQHCWRLGHSTAERITLWQTRS